MTLKHTPGPWEPVDMGRDGLICVMPKSKLAVADCCDMNDARLIAAAPDLLAALQYLADMVSSSLAGDDYAPFSKCVNQARAAIAKATGE